MAEAYERSFGRLCVGTTEAVLDAIADPGLAHGRRPRLLDVGTGTGALARAAVDRGYTVDAVDAETTMVAHAAHISSGIEFAVSISASIVRAFNMTGVRCALFPPAER